MSDRERVEVGEGGVVVLCMTHTLNTFIHSTPSGDESGGAELPTKTWCWK